MQVSVTCRFVKHACYMMDSIVPCMLQIQHACYIVTCIYNTAQIQRQTFTCTKATQGSVYTLVQMRLHVW